MKKIVLDQGLAPRVADILRGMGWDAVHVSAVGFDHADDLSILTFAAESGRVCVTLDHDFHAHLAVSRANQPSVVFFARRA